jgi:predicted ABC-type ATPase
MGRVPNLVILAGPNGAGKSTAATVLLPQTLGISEFVNADTIARGLSAFAPETVTFRAGRIMRRRLRELGAAGADFAFETTLATRTYLPWLRDLRDSGYRIHLIFLYIASAETCVQRVARRVALGGHDVPEDMIRRRHDVSLRYFFTRYRHEVNTWRLFDNSGLVPGTVAKWRNGKIRVERPETWGKLIAEYG